MKSYYLQAKADREIGGELIPGRRVITEEINPDLDLLDTCQAGSWIEAKQKFGYGLTRRQADTLEGCV